MHVIRTTIPSAACVADGRPKLALVAHSSRWFICVFLCFMFLWCDLVFLVPFTSQCVSILCYDTGCFGVFMWVLQLSVVGDPLLSFDHIFIFHIIIN